MAMVLRAKDEALGRTVALKILAPALAGDQEFRERFVRESRAVAAVDHPHIIPVYAAGEASGVLYLAMRFVSGGDLRSVVQREGPLPGDRAVFLLSPVASALDAAHAAGLVHRDVKPANILVDASPGRPEHPYLSDFGLAKGSASSTGLTGTGQFLGTPDYAAPEQISGKPARPQTDQYALACVMYTMLTGSLPFAREESMAVLWAHMYDQPPSLTATRPDLPTAADQVLARALAKSPDDRYATCGDLIGALRAALDMAPGQDAEAGLASADSSPARAGGRQRHSDRDAWAPTSHTQTVTPPPAFPSDRGPTGAPRERSFESFPVPAATGPIRDMPVRWRGIRRPVVTATLIVLAMLLAGGGFGFWQYNQSKYYVGVQDGNAAIFRGANRSLAGIALSSLVQRSALRVSQLPGSDQASLTQTISQGSESGAQALIDQLQAQVIQCRQQWQAVAAWPTRNAKYQAELATARKSKVKVPVSDIPGPLPNAPDPAKCAPATVLGVLVPSPATPSGRAAPATTAKAVPAPPASTVTVDVYNGGSAPGLATSVSLALVALGYKPGAVTDATAQSQVVTAGTQVFYGNGASANAEKIAKYFGAHVTALSSLPANHVEVLLGSESTAVPAGLAPADSGATTGTVYVSPTPTAPAPAQTCQYQGDPTCGPGGQPTPNPTSSCSYDPSDGQYDNCTGGVTPTPTPTPTCSYDPSDGQYDNCTGNGGLSTSAKTATST
jgi:serine/threonine-protein kinase